MMPAWGRDRGTPPGYRRRIICAGITRRGENRQRSVGARLVLGGGLALGSSPMLVPRPLRASALLGVLRFAWHRLVDTRPQDPV